LALTGLTALTLTGLLDLALGLALVLGAAVAAAFLTVRLRHLPILSFHKQSALESHEDLSKDGHLVLDADAGLGFGGDFAFLEPGFCACPHLDVLAFHLHTTHSS
jgi:hypothetical protein